MSVQIEETGPVERKLRIEVATADVDAAFEQVYRGMKQAARIPGFRKGKVPRSVVQRYFGERARGEVLDRIVQESLGKALDESGLDVIGEPRIDPQALPSEGEPYAYEAQVDIRPAIELQKIRGLEVTKPELPEPEQDPVEAHLEQLRLQQAQVHEEADGVAAREDCFAPRTLFFSLRSEMASPPFLVASPATETATSAAPCVETVTFASILTSRRSLPAAQCISRTASA